MRPLKVSWSWLDRMWPANIRTFFFNKWDGQQRGRGMPESGWIIFFIDSRDETVRIDLNQMNKRERGGTFPTVSRLGSALATGNVEYMICCSIAICSKTRWERHVNYANCWSNLRHHLFSTPLCFANDGSLLNDPCIDVKCRTVVQ